ncbi:MAG: hypothetical protein R2737_07875 [Candidatus Nanopelagicales bacterium]
MSTYLDTDPPTDIEPRPRPWTPPDPPRWRYGTVSKNSAAGLRLVAEAFDSAGVGEAVRPCVDLLDRADALDAEHKRMRATLADNAEASLDALVAGDVTPQQAAARLRKARAEQADAEQACEALAIARDRARREALDWCRANAEPLLAALDGVVRDAAADCSEAALQLDGVTTAEDATRAGVGDHWGAMLRAVDKADAAWAASDRLDAAAAILECAMPSVLPARSPWRHCHRPDRLPQRLPVDPGLRLAAALDAGARPGVVGVEQAWANVIEYATEQAAAGRHPEPWNVGGLR